LKNRMTVVLIIVLLVLISVAFYTTTNVGRQPSGFRIERQRPGNTPLHTAYVSTLPVNESDANVIIADITREQLAASNQPDVSPHSANTTILKICISQWLQDAITVEETFDCMKTTWRLNS
jgi:hypothetical protein